MVNPKAPADVLTADLPVERKRALLASWASDARAVTNAPALRRLDDGTAIEIDVILDALKRLDGLVETSRRPSPRRKPWWIRDDDDDPPTAPAAVMRVPPLPSLEGAAVAA